MSHDLQRLRDSLEELAGEARRRQGPAHPDPEELIAYAAGKLQPAAAAALLEHLAVCRPCARLAIEMQAFLQAPPLAPDAAADSQAGVSWQAFRARLAAEPEPAGRAAELTAAGAALPPPARLIPIDRAPQAASPWRTSLALAAGLALCVIGFSSWIATHRPLSRSRKRPPIVAIPAPEALRGEAAGRAAPVSSVRLDAEAAALILYLAEPQPYPRFRVEIHPAQAATAASALPTPIAPATSAISQQEVLVLLTHHQLPPGDYRIRLLGLDSAQEQLVEEVPLRVLPPGDS